MLGRLELVTTLVLVLAGIAAAVVLGLKLFGNSVHVVLVSALLGCFPAAAFHHVSVRVCRLLGFRLEHDPPEVRSRTADRE